MWFKNISVMRQSSGFTWGGEAYESLLSDFRLRSPGPLELETRGFLSPFSRPDAALSHTSSEATLFCLGQESRMLPASVLRDAVDARIAEHEATTGRKPGKRLRNDFVATRRQLDEALASLAELEKAAAPQFVAGEVTEEMCQRVAASFYGADTFANGVEMHEALQLWRKELGPALGLVTREEMAAQVREAYIDIYMNVWGSRTAAELSWLESNARKRLEAK